MYVVRRHSLAVGTFAQSLGQSPSLDELLVAAGPVPASVSVAAMVYWCTGIAVVP